MCDSEKLSKWIRLSERRAVWARQFHVFFHAQFRNKNRQTKRDQNKAQKQKKIICTILTRHRLKSIEYNLSV